MDDDIEIKLKNLYNNFDKNKVREINSIKKLIYFIYQMKAKRIHK